MKPEWCDEKTWKIASDILNGKDAVEGALFSENYTSAIAKALLTARQEGRAEAFEEAAKRLEPIDGGYFNPPEGFYEALASATDADEIGFREFRGDTGNWAHFMHLILVPYAASIRKAGEE